MRHVLGAVFSIAAAYYLYVAVSQRARRLAERRAAGIPDDAEPQSRMFVFGEIMRPIVLFFLAYLAVKAILVYVWLDAERYLSLFDLGGFVAALAAYGYWVVVKTKYPPLAFYRTEVAANDTDQGTQRAVADDRRAAA